MTTVIKTLKDGAGHDLPVVMVDDGAGHFSFGHVPLNSDGATPVSPATAAKQDTLAGLVGDLSGSPPANTVLDGLKTIAANVAATTTALGSVVLAAGTAVIGKVGLQVSGADVSNSNPVYVTTTQDAVAGNTGAASNNSFLRYLRDALYAGVALSVGGSAVSASNRLPVAQPDMMAFSGSISSAAVLSGMPIDCTGYGSISLQVTNAGTGCTLTYETSEDNTTWFALGGLGPSGTGGQITTSTALAVYQFRVFCRYFRVRCSTYGSGTPAVVGSLHKDPTSVTSRITVDTPATAGITASTTGFMGLALAKTSNPTAVTDGQQVRPLATLLGAMVVRPYSIPEADWKSGPITLTASNQVLAAAAGAGIKNYATWCVLTCNASWTANTVQVQDGTTVIFEIDLPAGAGVYQFPFPSPLATSANAALNIKATGSVTGTCKANFGGYAAA